MPNVPAEIEAIKTRITELEESSARAYEWLEGVDEAIYKCIEHMSKRSLGPESAHSAFASIREWWEDRPKKPNG